MNFSEPLDTAGAKTATNYTIDNGVSVMQAPYPDYVWTIRFKDESA